MILLYTIPIYKYNMKRYMKKTTLAVALALTSLCSVEANAQNTAKGKDGYPIAQVPFTSVKVSNDSFWGERLKAAREVTVPLAFSKCEETGRYDNFVHAAKHLADPTQEFPDKGWTFTFDDTDPYKTIEGASYILLTLDTKGAEGRERQRMICYMDSVLDIIAAGQEPDGYLYTPRTKSPSKLHSWAGPKRWSAVEELSHELYNLGHMVDAACAHYQATQSRKFLDIAVRYADCVVREVGPNAGQARVVPGHQIAEMALARLYVLINSTPALKNLKPKAQSYLDEAKFFLDNRSKTQRKDLYSQSHMPVTEQAEAVGHAVRAGYMYSGMADVAALMGDTAYIHAIDNIWENIVGKKYYITGGVGARHEGEAFGDNYELPNLTAYNETCAAIAQVYLNQRMFLLHGEAKYIDCLERTLYNGVISGMSMDGGRFFYPNPLEADGVYAFNADNTKERQPWFGCACCPSNLCRFIPSVPGYVYAVDGKKVYVNLFMSNNATLDVAGKAVTLMQNTSYPQNGDINISVGANKAGIFTMMIRVPGWVQGDVVPSDLYRYDDGKKLGYEIKVNGEKVEGSLQNGYMAIERKWKKGDVVSIHFDMEPRIVVANEKVKDDAGRIAIERGPLVYCAEFADNKGIDIQHLSMPLKPELTTEYRADLFGGINTIVTTAQTIDRDSKGWITAPKTKLTLIPYYAWNHRGIGKMQVWMKR